MFQVDLCSESSSGFKPCSVYWLCVQLLKASLWLCLQSEDTLGRFYQVTLHQPLRLKDNSMRCRMPRDFRSAVCMKNTHSIRHNISTTYRWGEYHRLLFHQGTWTVCPQTWCVRSRKWETIKIWVSLRTAVWFHPTEETQMCQNTQ